MSWTRPRVVHKVLTVLSKLRRILQSAEEAAATGVRNAQTIPNEKASRAVHEQMSGRIVKMLSWQPAANYKTRRSLPFKQQKIWLTPANVRSLLSARSCR